MKLAVYVTVTCEQPAVCRDDFTFWVLLCWLCSPAFRVPEPFTPSQVGRSLPWITGSPAHQ